MSMHLYIRKIYTEIPKILFSSIADEINVKLIKKVSIRFRNYLVSKSTARINYGHGDVPKSAHGRTSMSSANLSLFS